MQRRELESPGVANQLQMELNASPHLSSLQHPARYKVVPSILTLHHEQTRPFAFCPFLFQCLMPIILVPLLWCICNLLVCRVSCLLWILSPTSVAFRCHAGPATIYGIESRIVDG
jgi:hypothetical protein